MQIHPRNRPQVLTSRWGMLSGITPVERDLLAFADAKPCAGYMPGASLAAAGTLIRTPLIVVSGWVCAQRMLANGRRQIVSLLLPGDVIGLDPESRHAPEAIISLTATSIAACPELNIVYDRQPHFAILQNALAVAALEDRHYLHDTIVRLGRQTAYERLAHLIMELEQRLQSRGVDVSFGFALPITQEMIADLLGMSVVHVNRTMQQMRREGLVEIRAGRIRLLDRDRLQGVAEFRPPVVTVRPRV